MPPPPKITEQMIADVVALRLQQVSWKHIQRYLEREYQTLVTRERLWQVSRDLIDDWRGDERNDAE